MALFGYEQNPLEQAGIMGGVAGLGGGLSALFGGGGWGGKSAHAKQFPTVTPQASQLLNWLMSQGQQNADFGKIRENEINQFNTQTIPGLAERFTAMGTGGGGQRSSGFQNALGMAASNLHQNLGAQQAQFGMQQMGMGLQPQFENMMMPRKPGALEGIMGSISSLLPLLLAL
jgi:hypothetical protein